GGDSWCGIDCIEVETELARLRERRSRGCVEPAQGSYVGNARNRKLERERCEVCFENLRCAARHQLALFRFRPDTVTDAGSNASGAPAALLRWRGVDANGLETCHARTRREARHPREAAVDDDPHSFDR